jgi:hypothetical protein|nr:MAG TPA: hypothetical protein [Caudoviricetes sp.]
MTDIQHLSLPQMFIEPSAYPHSVIVYPRKGERLLQGVVIFCSQSVLNVIRILNQSSTQNEWDVEFVESYMKRFL